MSGFPRWRGAWPRPFAYDGSKHLALLHRLAIVYLMAPAFIWLAGWFKWWFGVPAAVLLGVALAPALRGAWRLPRPSVSALAIALLALTWTMLTAHGGVFDGNNGDWIDRRALLLDLSRHPWPVYVRDDLTDHLPWGGGEQPALLRYYLAWYMVPGLAGRVFGPAALNWAVPLWTALGAALVLLLFARGFRGHRAVLVAGAFVLFGGMDPLRILLLRGSEFFQFGIDQLGWPGVDVNYFEWAALAGVRPWYMAHSLSLMMAPHILPAALGALLLLHLRRHSRFVSASGVVLATVIFWSPFVALGLLPLAVVLICDNALRRRRALASWANVCLAAPLAGLYALYLASGSLAFDHGWLWEQYGWHRLAKWAGWFYGSECLLLLLLALVARPRFAREPFFAATTATLLLLPWYYAGDINLAIQGALPSLALLCWFCVRALPGGASARTSGDRFRPTLRSCARGALLCALAIGATGSLMNMAIATHDDVGFAFAASGLTTFGLSAPLQRENLAAEVQPPLAHVLRRTQALRRADAPHGPVFTADFNVHVRDKNLVFANDRCGPDDRLIRVRFLPTTLNTNAHTKADAVPRWYGPGCGAMVGLPGWPVLGARVGQTPGDGGDWAVEVLFDEAGEVAGLSHPPACAFYGGEVGRACARSLGVAALRQAHDRVRNATPTARSHFDVYVDEWLTYVRAPCVFDDIKTKFFLHLVPWNAGDLPAGRTAGFDNRDFAFGAHGALFDGKCVATWRLPYPVAKLRTGQFTGEGELWSASFERSAPPVK